MDVKDALVILEKDKEFKDWRDKNKEFFLTNAFIMIQGSDKINKIQIGYFNKKEDKITSFIVDKEKIEMFSDKIFKEPDAKVEKIDIKNVRISIKEALKEANKAQKKYYANAVSTKKILLLQNQGKGDIWNITFITNSLEILHFNIDCKKGGLLMHEKTSLLQVRSN
ncbi:hypothetical protein KY313_03100 [Candidatus Woesearchaeota archaeon]|jgi:hypothetical protein|nr:hypothetical protein [Candidatus Woesearchaeota archaeon]